MMVTYVRGHFKNIRGTLEFDPELWVADITYIRPLVEFAYLAVIVDAFSRRVIGWCWTARWKPH